MKFCGLVFSVGRSLPCRHLVPLRCERGSLIPVSQMRKSRPELLKVTCTLVQWELSVLGAAHTCSLPFQEQPAEAAGSCRDPQRPPGGSSEPACAPWPENAGGHQEGWQSGDG